jgi:hypothetical protein
LENALKKYIEKSQSQNFDINFNSNTKNNIKENYKLNNDKLWNELNHQKIDLCNLDYYQFKINEEDIENNSDKFPMKIVLSELLKKRNSKSCKYK